MRSYSDMMQKEYPCRTWPRVAPQFLLSTCVFLEEKRHLKIGVILINLRGCSDHQIQSHWVISISIFNRKPWIFGDVQIQSCWIFSCWNPYSKSSFWFLTQILLYVFPSCERARALVLIKLDPHEQFAKKYWAGKRYSRTITYIFLMANQTIKISNIQYLVGGFNPSEKYESQWEGLSHIWNGT